MRINSRMLSGWSSTRRSTTLPLPRTPTCPTIRRQARTGIQQSEPGVVVGRVICLGTGAALNAERAQTSVAVRISDGETLLFDASSGTIVLERLRGPGIPLQGIRHLFVSHRHFDHVGGLAPLLVAMVSLPEARLTVYALPKTLGALRNLLALTIPGVEDWLGERLGWQELAPDGPIRAGDSEVTPFLVDHTVECAGFRIAQGGTTLVSAADTRPCPEVV